MTRADLIVHHQNRSAEYYEYARWVMGKAGRANQRGAVLDWCLRRNQFQEESHLGAVHSMTARLLMGVEDA